MRNTIAYFAKNKASENEKLLYLLMKEMISKRQFVLVKVNMICVKTYFSEIFSLFIYLKKYSCTLLDEGNIFMKL